MDIIKGLPLPVQAALVVVLLVLTLIVFGAIVGWLVKAAIIATLVIGLGLVGYLGARHFGLLS